MNAIGGTFSSESCPERVWSGLGQIGGSHECAKPTDGMLSIEHDYEQRAGAHAGDEVVEEAFAAMFGIEVLRFCGGERATHHECDGQVVLLNGFEDRAVRVVGDRIGFDETEGTFESGRQHACHEAGLSCVGNGWLID